MKGSRVNWPIFFACIAASAALGVGIHFLFGMEFWLSWAIVVIAWSGVGITTLVDDYDEEKRRNAKEKHRNSARSKEKLEADSNGKTDEHHRYGEQCGTVFQFHRRILSVLPNNAFERTVNHRGPRLAAAWAAWPAAQLGR